MLKNSWQLQNMFHITYYNLNITYEILNVAIQKPSAFFALGDQDRLGSLAEAGQLTIFPNPELKSIFVYSQQLSVLASVFGCRAREMPNHETSQTPRPQSPADHGMQRPPSSCSWASLPSMMVLGMPLLRPQHFRFGRFLGSSTPLVLLR